MPASSSKSQSIKLQSFSFVGFMLVDFLWWVSGKSWAGEVCVSVQVFSPLEPKQLAGSGQTNIRSRRRNGGKTISVSDRSIARSTCHVRTRKLLQKALVKGTGQANGRIRLKSGGPIATMGWLNLF